tara:strand:- start:208 stop:489 length:282 start_codon:yes stop_codon:yes gene_type:complete
MRDIETVEKESQLRGLRIKELEAELAAQIAAGNKWIKFYRECWFNVVNMNEELRAGQTAYEPWWYSLDEDHAWILNWELTHQTIEQPFAHSSF